MKGNEYVITMQRTVPLLLVGLLACVVLWLSGATLPPVYAQSDLELETLARANQLYQNGSFAEAVQTYQQVIDRGVADSTVYYNLGNAYFRQGDLGRAILNYERAARLRPRDTDIQTNLAVAQEHLVDDAPTRPLFIARWFALSESLLTRDEAARLALTFWLLCGGLIWLMRRVRAPGVRRSARYALAVVTVLLFGSIALLGSHLYLDYVRPPAIVLVDELPVMSGPGAHYAPAFTLHSGAKVSVLAEQNGWVHLAWAGDQAEGWAAAGAIEPIRPPD